MSRFKNTLLNDAFWLKTFYIVAFYFVYRVLDVLVLIVAAGHWLFQLVTGSRNDSLHDIGQSLGIYSQQIIHFLTSVTEEKPFPFQDWPKNRPDQNND
ncbi:MAG: DUF4389 domain-containing protein [Venatoribacter sp.]